MSELEKLAEHLGRELLNRGEWLATAESCTGGWVAQSVTAIAGSSTWFDRGFVTYSNQAKMELLIQHYNASIRELHHLQEERTALRNSMEQKIRGGGYIKVKQKLYPGVVVEIRGVRREIKDELRFVSFRFDSDTGSITMGSYR